MSSSLSLRSILDANKLTGSNFMDWYRNLRIVLRSEKVAYVLDANLPVAPKEGEAGFEDFDFEAHKQHMDDNVLACCIMLASMGPELQRQHEHMDAPSIIMHLKELYDKKGRHERYETSRELFSCRMSEGASVSSHVLKMIGLIEKLGNLGFVMDAELSNDLVLTSLPPSFSGFIMNYNMHNMCETLPGLLSMLTTAEVSIKKDKTHALLIGGPSKAKGKGKGLEKPNPLKPKGKSNKKKGKGKGKAAPKDKGDVVCFHCGKSGHWKRNCPDYLKSVKAKKHGDASTSGIHMIEINFSCANPASWVLDTGCGSHICNMLQVLKNPRKLEKNEVDLRVGNGARVVAAAIGDADLVLPTGLLLHLKNCLYVPNISRNIISISCLEQDGFYFTIKGGEFSIIMNDIIFATASLVNDLYVLEMRNEVLNINVKRPRIDNQSYLWHCRLGHINETRLSRLHANGYLDSMDLESYGQCESCLAGKMTQTKPKKPESHRASELLQLIHTDVCGPMSIEARGGYSYFITFTDDMSRFGYIYLMRHKSEAFEKFKEYRNEVEKQRGKMIKTLRSHRGGVYLSNEFQDYLKENGILSQLTAPYTPHQNGVSERRNRTLLDMVRSMMSETQLPKSFWGYALDTATYLLNRVPSKSVQTTPYEIWNGRRPNLSYLKVWGSPAYVKTLTSDKLSAKSAKCLFVGYPKGTKGYYFYSLDEHKVFVSKNAEFLEKDLISQGASGSKI